MAARRREDEQLIVLETKAEVVAWLKREAEEHPHDHWHIAVKEVEGRKTPDVALVPYRGPRPRGKHSRPNLRVELPANGTARKLVEVWPMKGTRPVSTYRPATILNLIGEGGVPKGARIPAPGEAEAAAPRPTRKRKAAEGRAAKVPTPPTDVEPVEGTGYGIRPTLSGNRWQVVELATGKVRSSVATSPEAARKGAHTFAEKDAAGTGRADDGAAPEDPLARLAMAFEAAAEALRAA